MASFGIKINFQIPEFVYNSKTNRATKRNNVFPTKKGDTLNQTMLKLPVNNRNTGTVTHLHVKPSVLDRLISRSASGKMFYREHFVSALTSMNV